MNLREKKGSISIFVLVALLFMAGFLIISFASNINKSKTIKEQFNIISGIYSYTNGDEGAYDKAYTDLRQKNKKLITVSTEGTEDTATLELTKTFEDKVSNYRIYGSSEGVGDNMNLFDMNSITKFYGSGGTVKTQDTISNGVITNNYGYANENCLCDSNITSLSAGKYILSVDVFVRYSDNNWITIGFMDTNKTAHTKNINLQFFINKWVRVSYEINLTEDTGIFGFYFLNHQSDTDTLFKNIELRQVDEFPVMPEAHQPFERYKLKLDVANSKNLFNFNEITNFYYLQFNSTDRAFSKISANNDNSFLSYVSDNILINKMGYFSHMVLCNSNVKKLKQGTYTISADVMKDDEDGSLSGFIGVVDSNNTQYKKQFYLSEYKKWEKMTYTFTLANDIDILGFVFQGTGTGEEKNYIENLKFKNIQLEKGDKATEYQEYIGGEIYIYSPLYEGDYIDFKTKKVVRANGTQENIDLPQLSTHEDYTKIEVVTESKPSRIEIEYTGYTLD